MFQSIKVRNFKSIREIDLNCKRVNIFIGEPNSGKSNFLECFNLLNKNESLLDFIRFDSVGQLFYDFDTSQEIKIVTDVYDVRGWIDEAYGEMRLESHLGFESPFLIKVALNGKTKSASSNGSLLQIPRIRYYKFQDEIRESKADRSFLEPPAGQNIAAVILANKSLRTQIQNLLEGLGYKLLFKHDSSNIEIYKEFDGFSVSFPLALISDTVRRMMFYLAAIESNSKATIIFEEPESNTFPLYIKYLAERVALFSDNQFFITTHNPYFLQAIIEKTPSSDLTINLVRMENFETKITTLKQRAVEEILNLSSDVFLNFDKLLEE